MKQGCLADIRPADLPSPPQSSLIILRACAKKEVGLKHISSLVSKDTVLTAELLRVVNSAYFGMSKEVKSLTRAVTVLGNKSLRNMVLCLTMRDVINQKQIANIDLQMFWLHSLQRAVGARQLGQLLGMDGEECFVAGLLQDFGFLALYYVYPEQVHTWDKLSVLDPAERHAQEQLIFQTSHDQIIATLSKTWLLPDELSQALAGHHHATMEPVTILTEKLSFVLKCADWIAAIFNSQNKPKVLETCNQLLESCKIDDNQRETLLASIPENVESTAQSLGIHISENPEYEQIMRDANLELAEANLSYQELTWKLQSVLKERDRYAAELNKEIQLATEVQKSLLPSHTTADFPIHGINVPAKQLSGDFFDYFTRSDGKIYFSLGDVSGKGMNAALLMSKTASLIRCLGKQIADPSRLMAIINAEICETAVRGMFVTLVLGIFDPAKDLVRIVNAGNPPAIIISPAGKINNIDAQTPPIGIISNCEFNNIAFKLGNNSLYVYSDGVTESDTAEGEMLGANGLVNILGTIGEINPAQRLRSVISAINSAQQTAKDDMTMLLLENVVRENNR